MAVELMSRTNEKANKNATATRAKKADYKSKQRLAFCFIQQKKKSNLGKNYIDF
jgi:hypothetical protein